MLTGITAIRYNNEFRANQNLSFLLGCIGEKISVEIDFFWEDIFIATADESGVVKPSIQLIGTLLNPQELVYSSFANAFSDYQVGDQFRFSFSGAGFTPASVFQVTEKINNNILRCAGVNFVTQNFPNGGYIYRISELRSVNYSYNLIDSGNSFTSLVDGELQKLTKFISGTNVFNPMNFLGQKGYQIGSAEVKLIQFTAARYQYTLKHNLFITPFFLSSQYADLLLRVKPSYYSAGNCLKYISQIGLNRSANSPTGEQFIAYDQPANTGWFNETFNGGTTNYLIDSYTLTRVSDATLLTALEFTNEIEAVITIKNTVNSPFLNAATKFTLNFCYLPESQSLYQNNGNDLKTNFVFDRALNTVGVGNVNGDNFGTGMQVIKTMQILFTSTTEVQVKARIQVGATAQSIITAGDFSRYMLWVTTENHILSATNSDKVALLTDVNEFYVQRAISNLITNETKIIAHPYELFVDGQTTADAFPTDDIVAKSKFSIDFTGKETDGIKLLKINPKLTLVKAGTPDIILEDFLIDTSAFTFIGSLFQNVNYQQDRVFKINPGDIRKVIKANNEFTLDTALVKNWEVNYPFMMRWEYWIALLNLTNPPGDIFNSALSLNGINNFWHRYTTVTGWFLKYSITYTFEQKGEVATQTFVNPIQSFDYNSNPQWISETIKSYDINTLAELTSGGNKFLQGYQNTKLIATFVWNSVSVPLLSDIGIVFWAERFEAGGIVEILQISSFRVVDSGSVFTSTDASGKVVVTNIGSSFFGECLIDQSLMAQSNKYTIYARLYHLPIIFDSKQFEDLELFEFENGSAYYFEN